MKRQRRLYQLGVSAGIVTMVLGALMAIAPVAGAQDGGNHADPRGNNGTVKIDGVHDLDGPGHGPGPNEPGQDPDDDPHVECAFELEFFGFDEGQTADVRITAHAPTGTGEKLLDEREDISDDAAGGAGLDPDVVIAYDLSDELSQFEPHDVHGWHVKLTLTLYNADGSAVPGGQKHKVFWIEPCVYEVGLDKMNDADGDGTFTDSETAESPGDPVEFQVVITNTGTAEVTLVSLVDTWPGQAMPLDLLALENLDCERDGVEVELDVDRVLPAGSTTTCTYTVGGYAPAPGDSLVNTVTVAIEEGVGDEDTSTVTTATYSIVLVKDNDANRDEEFTDSEQAPEPLAEVPFRIELRNTGSGDLTIDTLVDTWGDAGELDLLDADEVDLTCTRGEGDDRATVDLVADPVLPAGSTTVCFFTVAGYAPPAGDSLVNTVAVTTDEGVGHDDTSTVSTPPVNPTFSVALQKLNDADGVDGFGETETASEPGADVEFQVTIENTGEGALVLQALTDLVPGRGTIDLLGDDVDLVCAGGAALQVGSVLPVGSVTVCTFTLTNYAPDAGDALTNTVTVLTDEAEDSDTSTVEVEEMEVAVLPAPAVVNTPAAPPVLTPPLETPPEVLPDTVSKASPDEAPRVLGDVVTRALPRTGGPTQDLAGMGAFLLVLGAAMVLGSRRHLARR